MTPHIEAKKSEIAKIVIMPGDPMRALFIAKNYLKDYKCINDVRNELGFTGYYKGKRISVMASGMGNPSMGIYSYELFNFYDVDIIIRVGSMGAYSMDLDVFDVVLADEIYSESNYATIQYGYTSNVIKSSSYLNDIIVKTSKNLNINLKQGRIHCSDVFYRKKGEILNDCLGVEMESLALISTAHACKKNATCILTVSDHLVTQKATTSETREKSFTDMIELALESTLNM